MSIRVLISNRINVYAEGLRRLLEEAVDSTGPAMTCKIAAPEASVRPPPVDLIVSDAACFGRWAGCGRKILLIWDTPQSLPPIGELKELVDKGLAGIVDAELDPALLQKAVTRIHAGELWIDHRIIQDSLSSMSSASSTHLSRREYDVLQHICNGCSNK
ncbi:MAG: response regulator transcription factor, partial [Desulfuromonadales bacterium]|nr:response regulator transcription factor [Desulfuromonadales bacterium]NIR33118.1 response regulator transcription factor [Desulfuromonadales bacterium]NIS40606.1 response regulator transcription factor [Desulfuromonadales bacterium]